MKPFEIVISDGKISRIYDRRYSEKVDITNGKGTFGCVCYTLRDEDVNALPKRNYMPHAQCFAEVAANNDGLIVNAQYNVTFQITLENSALNAIKQFSSL